MVVQNKLSNGYAEFSSHEIRKFFKSYFESASRCIHSHSSIGHFIVTTLSYIIIIDTGAHAKTNCTPGATVTLLFLCILSILNKYTCT